MPVSIEIKGEGLTFDLLLWRKYGRPGQSMLTETLKLNPGLSKLGPFLPLRAVVYLPDPPNPRRTVRRQPVDLFGGD